MPRLRDARLVLAGSASALLVLAGPYVGVLRARLRAALPGRFGLIVNTILAALLIVAAASALARIRERRALRYVVLLLAGVLGVTFARYNAVGLPDSIVVERFHFAEYGLITWLFYRAWRPQDDGSALVLAGLAAFLVGIADEGLQWFVPGRYGELRDVVLNGAAIVCGALFSYALDPVTSLTRRWSRASWQSLALCGGLTLLALGVFVDVIHIGYLVRDGEESAFLSRYTATRLDALARDRARAWSVQAPSASPPQFSREDQYRTEGLWHVQARNEAWAAGDVRSAWHEDLILERYFFPVLDLGHRWPGAQRTDAQARAARASPGSFTSAANRYPIYPWNRTAFRLALVITVGGFVAGCLVAARRQESSPPVSRSSEGNVRPMTSHRST